LCVHESPKNAILAMSPPGVGLSTGGPLLDIVMASMRTVYGRSYFTDCSFMLANI
jgi:hypothetical protein